MGRGRERSRGAGVSEEAATAAAEQSASARRRRRGDHRERGAAAAAGTSVDCVVETGRASGGRTVTRAHGGPSLPQAPRTGEQGMMVDGEHAGEVGTVARVELEQKQACVALDEQTVVGMHAPS